MVFMYFKESFDIVHCGLLVEILRAYEIGLREVIVRLIERLYCTGTNIAKIVSADGVT